MPVQITMPALSPTMTEGKLARWVKEEGDTIEIGDVLAEIETDKATMEVEAVEEGILGKKLVGDDTDDVAVNAPIGILLQEGEGDAELQQAVQAAQGGHSGSSGGSGGGNGAASQEPQAPSSQQPQTPAPEPAAASVPQREPQRESGNETKSAPSPSAGPAPAAQQPAPPAPSRSSGERVFASPLARRLAAEYGVDLTAMVGSGPHGRIVRADVEAAREAVPAAKPAAEAQAAPSTAPQVTSPATSQATSQAATAPARTGPSAKDMADFFKMPYREEPVSTIRKTIAQRMVESKTTVPHFYLTVDIEVDKLLKLRKELNEKGDDYKLSVNDLLIKASAVTLKRVPAVNVYWNETSILHFDDADVSVAVATETGLITPVVKQADKKGLIQISRDMKDLANRAREGKLKPEEYQGGTFSISNLGMFGIKHFEAIINPPQGALLAVGTSEQRPIVKDGALTTATIMSATLCCDHRAVDGALGAQWIAEFKKIVEDPMAMML